MAYGWFWQGCEGGRDIDVSNAIRPFLSQMFHIMDFKIRQPVHLERCVLTAIFADAFSQQLGQYFDTVFFHDAEQFKGHPSRALVAGFPLLNCRCACVQVAGKNRLTDVTTQTNLLDLSWRDFSGHISNAGLVEFPLVRSRLPAPLHRDQHL